MSKLGYRLYHYSSTSSVLSRRRQGGDVGFLRRRGALFFISARESAQLLFIFCDFSSGWREVCRTWGGLGVTHHARLGLLEWSRKRSAGQVGRGICEMGCRRTFNSEKRVWSRFLLQIVRDVPRYSSHWWKVFKVPPSDVLHRRPIEQSQQQRRIESHVGVCPAADKQAD